MIDRSLNYGRHLIRKFLADAMPFSSVMDIGAGSGSDLTIAAEINPNASRMAIELSQPYVERLTQQNILVHKLNIEKDCLPVSDGSTDVVIANQILEHTKELFWIFHEITRVLPLDGKLIIGVPNLASLHNRLLLLLGMQPTPIQNASAHMRGYTKHDVVRFLNLCFPGGYRLLRFGGSNFYPFPTPLARFLANLLPNLAWGIFMMLKKTKPYSDEFLKFPKNQQLETNFYLGEL